jgi:hypothetical protein
LSIHKSLALQHPADARKPSQGHRDAKEESREQIDRAQSYAPAQPPQNKMRVIASQIAAEVFGTYLTGNMNTP